MRSPSSRGKDIDERLTASGAACYWDHEHFQPVDFALTAKTEQRIVGISDQQVLDYIFVFNRCCRLALCRRAFWAL